MLLTNSSENKILSPDLVFIRNIYGDGNCFYRSLSYFFSQRVKIIIHISEIKVIFKYVLFYKAIRLKIKPY